MAQERKVFPMHTFVSYLKGIDREGNKQGVADMVGFMTGHPVDAELAPFAAALAKAWIYEQHPDLARMGSSELGDSAQNVSVTVLPPDVAAEVAGIFDKLTASKKTIAEQAARLAVVEKALAEKTAILNDVEVRLKAADDKVKRLEASAKDEGEKLVIASAAKVEDYIGKVDELLKLIEDVKKHGVVTVAASGQPAAASGETPSGEPADEFGLGGDIFASDKW